ncbi:hypothetical protein APICC_01047 [Apis cerana cerana]|uniref:Uncharacterized protein n=1 Tax=Apis cerana cerana TaxID=94128 RepID=A0A2A3E595_APICC|nr:hypothetical protein APICC_01047 [Apis cerana cerana]
MLNLSARKVKSLNDISEVFKKGDYAESEVSKVSFDENIVKEHFKKLYQAKKDVFLSLRIDLQSKDIEQSDSNISDIHEKNEEKELQKLKESKVNEDDRVKRVSKTNEEIEMITSIKRSLKNTTHKSFKKRRRIRKTSFEKEVSSSLTITISYELIYLVLHNCSHFSQSSLPFGRLG